MQSELLSKRTGLDRRNQSAAFLVVTGEEVWSGTLLVFGKNRRGVGDKWSRNFPATSPCSQQLDSDAPLLREKQSLKLFPTEGIIAGRFLK